MTKYLIIIILVLAVYAYFKSKLDFPGLSGDNPLKMGTNPFFPFGGYGPQFTSPGCPDGYYAAPDGK